MFKQPLNRGTSVLAALVFAAILGGIAVTIDGFSPSRTISQNRSALLAQSAAPQPPTIPACSTIKNGTKITVVDEEDAPKQPCFCEKIENNQRVRYTVNYTVSANVQSGNPVAETTQSVGEKVGDEISGGAGSCRVTYTDANGNQKSIYGSQSTLNQTLLERNASAKTDFPKLIALQEIQGKVVNYGPLSSETQDAVKNAFQEIKANNAAASSMGLGYSDLDLTSAEERINNYKTCGAGECLETPPQETPVSKPVELNQDLKTRIQNLEAACSAGNCDARDRQALEKLRLEANARTCPSGFSGTPPNCKPTNSGGCIGANCGGGGLGGGDLRTGGGNNSMLQSLLSGLARGLGMQQPPPPPPPPQPPQQCSGDQNSYQQQQQQYQYQMQQYQYQLQLYQMQQQQRQMQQLNGSYNPYSSLLSQPQQYPPQMPQQCTPSNQNQCQQQIPPPNPAGCTVGSWQPQYNGQCIVQWHCVPGTTGETGLPEARISCQPQIADVGMSVAITYSCTNSKTSKGEGFSTGDKLSGSATVEVKASDKNGGERVYEITCENAEKKTASAQCKVQVAKTSIVLVANPQSVASGEASSIGWVTTGMKSCVVSSPELPQFTQQNAANTSVNGMAPTGPVSSDATIMLKCTTAAGSTKSAETKITVK